MGDMADYYMDLAMEQEAQWEAEKHFRDEDSKEMEKRYMMGILSWTTIEEEEILVQNLSDEHLINCLAFSKRKEKDSVVDKWVELLGYEVQKRNYLKIVSTKKTNSETPVK